MSAAEHATSVSDRSSLVHRHCSQGHRHANASFLGIDQYCRELILEMILLNKPWCWSEKVIDPSVEPIRLSLCRVAVDDKDVQKYHIASTGINVCNISILRACRRLWLEGTYILYGHNSFESYNFQHLKYRLHHVVGRSNMLLMQRMTIGLPLKHKRDPEPYLGGFLEFFKEKLPNLRELNLTTQFSPDYWEPNRTSRNTSFREEYRAMLNTSAWITCRHPNLKKAVWLVESGGPIKVFEKDEPNNVEVDDSYTHWVPDDATSSQVESSDNLQEELAHAIQGCRLTVRLLATDRRFVVREQVKIDLVPQPARVVARDIILDSKAIRRKEWDDLLVAHPRDFALPETAVASEPQLPVVHRTPAGEMYATFDEACGYFKDQFSYLSMKDQSRLNAFRVS